MFQGVKKTKIYIDIKIHPPTLSKKKQKQGGFKKTAGKKLSLSLVCRSLGGKNVALAGMTNAVG